MPSLRAADFFAFRTPLLPFAEYLQWSEGLESPAAWQDPAALGPALARDKALLRERLRALVARPEVREAIYLASPDLEESLERWFQEPDGEKGQRTELALVRYFQRMAHRCTPFGLFAGHSMGRMGERTRLALEDPKGYQRHSRLDMDYLCGLVRELEGDRELRATLRYRPNTSLYRSGGRLRYAEAQDGDKGRTYRLVALKENEYLAATLERAKGGATIDELAAPLVDEDVSLDEARDYLHELIDNQVLVSDLEPEVTGPEPAPRLASLLSACPATAEAGGHLQATCDMLARLDSEGLGHAPEHYRGLARELEALPGKVDLSKLLQVDMHKPAPAATLGTEVAEELAKGLDLLHRLSPGGSGDAFSSFKEAFTKRYESRWMPLVEVLDPESGIGYTTQAGRTAEGAPLLEGLAFPAAGGQGGAQAGGANLGGWSSRDVQLHHLLQKIDLKTDQELVLSEEDVQKLARPSNQPLPDSLSTMAVLSAPSEEAVAAGDFRLYVQGAYGPSAARMLGRFCHGDEGLEAAVQAMLREEEAYDPERVYAEIVHLSQGRMGNVLARPALREHEIVFLGRSGAAEGKQIPVSDLLVSVVDGRVVLRSKSLGREIVPRMSSAANFSYRVLDTYKFLATLQGQGLLGSLGWSWGGMQSEPYLPRVVHGRLVLSRARWNVAADEMKPLLDAKSAEERYRAAQAWRGERRLPRFVLLADGDNELPVDLDNPLSVETFCGLLKGRGGFNLVEDFPGQDQLVAQGPGGLFNHELVVPVFRVRGEQEQPRRLAPPPAQDEAAETFAPGSEWLYLKLYGGQSSADRVLVETAVPLARRFLREGSADGWFFIRYADPDPHLRLRFHGDPRSLGSELLPELSRAFAPCLAEGTLWRVEMGTYERETSRYGGPANIARAEAWFRIDSEAVAELVAAYPGDEGAEARWKLCLAGVDRLLEDLGYDLEGKHTIASRGRRDFGLEFQAKGSLLERQLGDRFRKERKALDALMDPAAAPDPLLAPGLAALARRSERFAPLAAEMRRLDAAKELSTPFEDITMSLVHMFVNRAQRSAQRAQEFVVYDFLERLYDSRLARLKKGAKAAPKKKDEEPLTDPVS